MQPRKRWMILVLVLLPSVIGIATLSLVHLADRSASAPAAPTTTPHKSSPAAIQALPALETAPAAPVTAPVAPSTIDATEPGANEAEDPEQRPLIPTMMLADNQPAPSFELDSSAASDSFARSGPARRGDGMSETASRVG